VTRIVTTHYRYKRPPRRKKPVGLEVPAVVKAADPAKARRRTTADLTPKSMVSTSTKRAGASAVLPVANAAHAINRKGMKCRANGSLRSR
jgi:hypothetical protein